MSKKITALEELRDKVDQFAHKVAPIYQMLRWQWAGVSGDGIPDETEIKRVAYQLIQHMQDDRGGATTPPAEYITTGGIEVRYKDYKEHEIVELRMIIDPPD